MKFAIIGAGNMGGALARGLAKGSLVEASDITVADPSREKTDALLKDFPEMKIARGNKEAVRGADVVLFAVKPWLLQEVIEDVKDVLDYDDQAVISIAGGIGTAQLCQYLDRGDGEFPAVYYLIPNTAVAVMEGMTFITSVCSTPEMDAQILAIFKEMGDAMLVDERLVVVRHRLRDALHPRGHGGRRGVGLLCPRRAARHDADHEGRRGLVGRRRTASRRGD